MAIAAISMGLGFWNGLRVTMRDYPEGLNALDALSHGDVDIAQASEYPLVGKAFNKDRVRIIANVDKGEYFFVLGRRDRGIKNVADLKGKRIGVTFRTISEFYLGRFLILNGIQIGDVTRVDLTSAQLEDAIADGAVDAVVSREPLLGTMKRRLGANSIAWSAQSSQATYVIMVSRNDRITQHPELVRRFLNSLAEGGSIS